MLRLGWVIEYSVTYATYGHLVPSSLGRAQEVLNAGYAQWSKPA